MGVRRFISQILPDGHLSLPEDASKDIGKVFRVILIPLEDDDIYNYARTLAEKKGLPELTEDEIEKIIHESRGIK